MAYWKGVFKNSLRKDKEDKIVLSMANTNLIAYLQGGWFQGSQDRSR